VRACTRTNTDNRTDELDKLAPMSALSCRAMMFARALMGPMPLVVKSHAARGTRPTRAMADGFLETPPKRLTCVSQIDSAAATPGPSGHPVKQVASLTLSLAWPTGGSVVKDLAVPLGEAQSEVTREMLREKTRMHDVSLPLHQNIGSSSFNRCEVVPECSASSLTERVASAPTPPREVQLEVYRLERQYIFLARGMRDVRKASPAGQWGLKP
jgi:hypothetical protein